MSTDSAFFLLCFLPLLGLLYYLLPWERGRNTLLLLGSLLFCAFGRLSGLLLLLGFSLANWLLLLDLHPGSVSVLGLMNDKAHRVHLLVDEDVFAEEFFGCHPCENTSSIRFATRDLKENHNQAEERYL